MQHQRDEARKSSSQILPLVIAAFAGATLAIACERPRVGADGGDSPDAARTAQQRTAQPTQLAQAPSRMPPREALTDPAITARINSAIRNDPGMAGADVSVNTDHGVVSLMGTVKSHEQTAVASAHAQSQDGVMRVDNHLSVPSQ